jgi:cold shock CspA family protein
VIEGVVAAFDDHAGWGVLETDVGEQIFFHCVSIRGGGRTIAVGARVGATRTAGQRGRDEAVDVHLVEP